MPLFLATLQRNKQIIVSRQPNTQQASMSNIRKGQRTIVNIAPSVCTDWHCIGHEFAYFAAASMDAPASPNNPGSQKPSCHLPFSSLYSKMPHRPATNSPHCMTGYAMDKPTCGSVVAMMEHMLPRFQQVPEAMPGRAACLECREGQGPCCTITRMAVTIGAAISTPAKYKCLLQQQKQC